jgi:hypothetical protein
MEKTMTTKTKAETLSQFVIDTKRATGIVDPKDLAKVVFDTTPPSLLEDFYRTALDAYVQMRLGVERNNVAKAAGTMLAPTNPTGGSGRSKKVKAVRSWWAEFCSQSLLTAHGWVPMGNATVADISFAAVERRTVAHENEAMAAKYEALAKKMKSVKAKTVAELSESDVKPIFA